jgi:hypothetical protein
MSSPSSFTGNAALEFIKTHRLRLIRRSNDGWTDTYIDDYDGSEWNLTYPDGHLHGGGSPLLQRSATRMDRPGDNAE